MTEVILNLNGPNRAQQETILVDWEQSPAETQLLGAKTPIEDKEERVGEQGKHTLFSWLPTFREASSPAGSPRIEEAVVAQEANCFSGAKQASCFSWRSSGQAATPRASGQGQASTPSSPTVEELTFYDEARFRECTSRLMEEMNLLLAQQSKDIASLEQVLGMREEGGEDEGEEDDPRILCLAGL